MLSRWLGVGHLPEVVARRLVAAVYSRRASQVMSALITVGFGLVAFYGTGSGWYLLGSAYAGAVATWRYRQAVAFWRDECAVSAERWALRNLYSGWATAVGWAGWTLALPLEPDPAIGAVVLALDAGLTIGGAFRNGALPAVAFGQIVIATVPTVLACLATNNLYYHYYVGVIALFTFSAFSINRSVHQLTVTVLLRQKEASDLAAELALVNEYLSEQAMIDPLTELMNRRAIEIAMKREWRAAARDGTLLSVLMIDVDHFKAFNDHYGHQVGDACLQDVAAVIKTVVRRSRDGAGRYGGEEFIVLLPAMDAEGAATVAANILAELSVRAIPHAKVASGRVSASIGVACATTDEVGSQAVLIGRADAALYAAKRGGRSRLFVFEEEAASVLAPAPAAIPILG